MKTINGIGVSPGIAIGKALVIKKTGAFISGILLKDESEVNAAILAFNNAIGLAVDEIEAIKNNTGLNLSDHDLAILETQIELTSDPQIAEDVVENMRSHKKNAGDALQEVINNLAVIFAAMDDGYMAGRAVDIRDIGDRILKHLDNLSKTNKNEYKPGTIIIADDLSPSDTITMDIKNVIGFATRAGSKTSHTAIIAKAKGIPAVVGCPELLELVKNGDDVVLDGTTGTIFISPDKETINGHVKKKTAYTQHSERLKTLTDKPSATADGVQIMLSANISGADDMEAVHENGGQGVGLLRTELLFMNRDTFPSENEQFEFYKQVALKARGKPVIVRTIDIGGDKQLPYFNIPAELNPFLGYRAIRICLDRTDLFITQLRAILRASVFGDLKVMFPMISNLQEIRAAKKIFEEAKNELSAERIDFNTAIKVGIMIEIPSAAITADILAGEIDFFSIGTNDLCQYTLAVDRMNDKITHLYDPFNPGVLRLISNVIEQGRKRKVHVGMCGEMAGDPLATVLLLGMGLTDFSMSPHAIPVIKNIIVNNSMEDARRICAEVMQMDNSEDIKAYLTQLKT